MLDNLNLHEPDITHFKTSLKRSGTGSIDEFLERRPEYIEIGKAFIALVLSTYENEDTLFSHDGTGNASKGKNWYHYLFQKMTAETDDISRNPISFITYNYDRSLEEYLFTALYHRYGLNHARCLGLLGEIEIVHIHGKLGNLIFGGLENNYSPIDNHDRLRRASAAISVIHESQKEHFLLAAQTLLQDADVIAFLGFGYHPTNMKRLRLMDCFQAEFYGTTFGMKAMEVESLVKSFGRKSFNYRNEDILDALREWGILETPRQILPFPCP
jgi:hypothetical protein